MKPVENMLAILGICAALLGPFAATGEGAGASLDAQGPDLRTDLRTASRIDAWIERGERERSEIPEPLWLESAPSWAESELEEDLDHDPLAAPVQADDGIVASNASSWEMATPSRDVMLGARSARGPPAV